MVDIGYWKLENELFKVSKFPVGGKKCFMCTSMCRRGRKFLPGFDTHIRLMLDFIFNIFCIDTDAAGEHLPFS